MNNRRVSYAGKRIYIGIDVHKSFFVACCLCEGEIVKRCRIPAKTEAVISLVSKYFSDSEVRTCYETGYSGFWLHRQLEAAGISNIIVHAAAIEVEAGNRVKTDKRDALKMAEQLSAGRLRCVRIPSKEEEHLRLLTRTREQLMGARRRVQIQIRMKLHQFGLFPDRIKRAITLKDVRELLPNLENAELIFSIELLLSQWEHLVSKIKELDKYLAEKAEKDPLEKIYRSAPGIGTVSARILSYELGDMSQFENERALFSFTGLTPGEFSTGDSIRRGHISRQGSARLRHVLIEASWIAIRKDKILREFFQRIAAKSGKKRAIVAVARKLVGKLRAAFKAGTLYEIEYRQTI